MASLWEVGPRPLHCDSCVHSWRTCQVQGTQSRRGLEMRRRALRSLGVPGTVTASSSPCPYAGAGRAAWRGTQPRVSSLAGCLLSHWISSQRHRLRQGVVTMSPVLSVHTLDRQLSCTTGWLWWPWGAGDRCVVARVALEGALVQGMRSDRSSSRPRAGLSPPSSPWPPRLFWHTSGTLCSEGLRA